MRRFLMIGMVVVLCGVFTSCTEKKDIQGETIEYTAGDAIFKGYIVYDKAREGKRPGVLVVHEWWGQNNQVRRRAEMLAGLGYTALVVDMYGGGRQAGNSEEAAELAKEVAENPDIRQARFTAAMNLLGQHETVDAERIAAIGYSFGGYVVLQMALDGADLDGVVSFHGGLLVKTPTDPGLVKARILILNGEKDWYITPQTVTQFKTDMKKTGADYQIISYKDAEHGYTNPEADILAEKFKGMHIQYNEEADRKSWADMQKFLETVFHQL